MANAVLSPYTITEETFIVHALKPILDIVPKSILYWDKISIPYIQTTGLPVLDSLAALGVLEPWSDHPTHLDVDNLRNSVPRLMKMLAERGQGGPDWVYIDAAGQTDFNVIDAMMSPGTTATSKHQTISLLIRDALPVPPPETAYEDILFFKENRMDELAALDAELEILSISLTKMADIGEAADLGQRRVLTALANIDKVMSEKWPNRVHETLRSKTGALTIGAFMGGFGAQAAGVPIIFGAIAGLASPLIEAVIDTVASSPSLPDRIRPYYYAFEAGRAFSR